MKSTRRRVIDQQKAMTEQDLAFFSGPGTRLAGRFYFPAPDAANGFGLLLAQGFGGTMDGTAPQIARAFAAAGYIVLSFDYRGFGKSDGAKARMAPAEQIEDIVCAIEVLAACPDVKADRIVGFGFSFGGGLMLCAAPRSGRLKAIVSAVPVTSGGDWLRGLNRHYEFVTLKERARRALTHKALTGEIELTDRYDIMIPDEGMRRLYPAYVPMAVESVLHVLDFEPLLDENNLRTPTFVVTISNDMINPTHHALNLFEKLRGAKSLHMFDSSDHFAIYNELLGDTVRRADVWYRSQTEGSRAG